MELGACPSKGAELRPHVDDDLGGRRAEILQPAPYACLEKFSRPTELLGSQGLAAKHDTSAGHPKVWQEKKQVQEQGTCPCVPQRLFPALLPQICLTTRLCWCRKRLAGGETTQLRL